MLAIQKKRGWNGWIAPGPNCTTVGLVMSLAPLYRAVGIERVIMSSYQAISGGGYPLIQRWREQRTADIPEPLSGLKEPLAKPELVLDGNVIGYIDKEEPKVRKETMKILGKYANNGIAPAGFRIDCFCVRVPVLRGHFETVFVETANYCSVQDVVDIYAAFNEQCSSGFSGLPSSPKQAVVVLDRSPQPRIDIGLYGGMATFVGRIEECGAYDTNGIKYHVLSDNTHKGAAKGVVQTAEYLYAINFLKPKSA